MNIAALRDPVEDFVDRVAEQQSVTNFCDGHQRCLIFRAARDSGATFFLQHVERMIDRRWFRVYADCRSNDPEVVFRKFFERAEERKLLRWRVLNPFRELGEAVLRFAVGVAASAAMPWLSTGGPAAAAILPKVATTPYSSASAERFAKLITSGRWKKPVLFLVDNVQEIKPQSLHILSTAFSSHYDHVRFVLCYVEGEDDPRSWDDFEARLHGFGLDVQVIDFPPPDGDFVSELANTLKVPLKPSDREQLLRVTERRVSRVVAMLTGATSTVSTLSPIDRELLRYLLVAEQPLQRDDIRTVVLASPRLAAGDDTVLRTIESLAKRGFVKLTAHSAGVDVELMSVRERFIRDTVSELAPNLLAAQELYRYFAAVQRVSSQRHSASAFGALLYRLARQVDPSSLPTRAFDLVRISLGQADLAAARRYVEEAIAYGAAPAPADLYALLAFHVSVEEYGQAAAIFAKFGDGYWSRSRVLRVIHAVVMNRLRHHKESNAEVDTLLSDPSTTNEEFALLTSYKVAALLHEGELSEAQEEFVRAYPRLRQARNRGYALRNCAAVYFWGDGRDLKRAETLLVEAAHTFRESRDAFGYYTCVNNRAALAGCLSERNAAVRAALPRFQEAFEALSIYGVHHLEEAGANLGIAYLLNGEDDRAAKHLRKMIAITSFDFPRVLMESALAFVDARLGDLRGARSRMAETAANAVAIGLPEACFRANLNAAALEAATNGASAEFARYVKAAGDCGFWGGRRSFERLLDAAQGKVSVAMLPDLFSFDLFQYWSQNPLAILPPAPLPQQAIRNDMTDDQVN